MSEERKRLSEEIAVLKKQLYDVFDRAGGDSSHPEVQRMSRLVDEKVVAYMKLSLAD